MDLKKYRESSWESQKRNKTEQGNLPSQDDSVIPKSDWSKLAKSVLLSKMGRNWVWLTVEIFSISMCVTSGIRKNWPLIRKSNSTYLWSAETNWEESMFRCHYLFDTIKNSIILWFRRMKPTRGSKKPNNKNSQQNSWFLLPVVSGEPVNSTGLCEFKRKENLLLGFKELSLPLIVNTLFSKPFSL